MKSRYVVAAVVLIVIAAAAAVFVVKGTSRGYRDGVYEGEYCSENGGGGTKVVLKIENNVIVDCQMTATDAEGHVKDESYGKNDSEANYRLCQISVAGMRQYPGELLKVQDIDKVDAVSGATVTHREFQIAVRQALQKAR